MWHFVIRQVVNDILKDCNAFIFTIIQPKKNLCVKQLQILDGVNFKLYVMCNNVVEFCSCG